MSVRLYVNKSDMKNGICCDSKRCAIHKAVERYGLLKGKAFEVLHNGIKVAPNYKLLDRVEEPQILFGDGGSELVSDFDNNGEETVPRHITLRDISGKFF